MKQQPSHPDITPTHDPYTEARLSGSAYLACTGGATDQLYKDVFDTLFETGKTHVAEAIGLCMHQYVLCALSSFPLPKLSPVRLARSQILKRIRNDRLLIANTGGVRTHASDAGLQLRKKGGTYVLNGATGFMSMSHVADFMMVSAYDPETENDALCLVAIKDNPGIATEMLFEGAMSASGTARVTIQECEVPSTNVYFGKQGSDASLLGMYQRIWFHGLVNAPYLGLAAAVLREVKDIAINTQTLEQTSLSETDGFIADIGRLEIKLNAAKNLARGIGIDLGQLKEPEMGQLRLLHESSAVAKYMATRAAEEIVHTASLLVGTKALAAPIVKAAKECIHFGRSHPISEFDIERYFGSTALGTESKEVLRWNS